VLCLPLIQQRIKNYTKSVIFYEEIFGYWAQKIWGPKTTYFRRLRNSMANLRANMSGEEHDIDNRETAMETKKGVLYRLKIS